MEFEIGVEGPKSNCYGEPGATCTPEQIREIEAILDTARPKIKEKKEKQK